MLGLLTNNNLGGSVERTITRKISKTVTQTEHYANSVGVSITVGAKFETGIPTVGAGEVSTEVTSSFEHEWGKETSKSVTYETEIACKAAAHTKVVCKYVANKAKMNVPYTMFLSKPGGWSKTITGTWTGVQTFEDHIVFEETHA
jgi:hypothetical protein